MSDGKKRIGKTALSAGSALLVLVILVMVRRLWLFSGQCLRVHMRMDQKLDLIHQKIGIQ